MLSNSGSSKLHSFSELDLFLSGSGIKIDSKFVTFFFFFNFEYWENEHQVDSSYVKLYVWIPHVCFHYV